MKSLSREEISRMALESGAPFSCYYAGPETNFTAVKMQVVSWWLAPPESGLRYYVTPCEDDYGRQLAADELKQWLRKKPS
jgi:hypothetical protein